MKRAKGLDRARRRCVPRAGIAPTATLIVSLLLSFSFEAIGATRTVTQEQVLVGSTTGVAYSQSDDSLVDTLTEADAATDPVTIVASESLAAGVRASGSFPGDLQISDNASLVYRETSLVRTVVASHAPTRNETGCGWSPCAAGFASDNVSASSAADLEVATYGGFGASLPPAAANLTVEVGLEAYEPSGNDRISVTVSWDGGATFCSNAQVFASIPPGDSGAFAYFDFTLCTGHTWSPADFAGDNVYARFTHIQVGGAGETVYLDANVLRVTYRVQDEYRGDLRFDWVGVPTGQAQRLAVEAAVSGENATLQVLTPPSTWTDRYTFSDLADRTFTYDLTPAEANGGAPAIRFVDAGPDATPSDLRIDHIAILTTILNYRLDVRHDISGVDGADPVLAIKGRLGSPVENFHVSVWNASSAAWNLRLDSAFSLSQAFYNVTLSPEEIDGGVVRVRYTDANATNAAPGRLELDLVAVATSAPGEPAFPMGLAAGLAAFAVALVLFLVTLRMRRSPPSPDPGSARRILPGFAAEARPGTEVLTGGRVSAAALKSGRSYVVEEETPVRSLKLLEDLTRFGRSGLFLTGRDPRIASQGFRLRRTKSFHLAEASGPQNGDSLAPSLETLTAKIEEFLQTNPVGVVLIEGADFLVERNRPRAVVRFLRHLVDTVSRGKQILLVSVSPTVLRERGLRTIVRGMAVVRPE